MGQSLFTPLAPAGLTSLKLQYDSRTDEHTLGAAREWAPGRDFSRYNHDFHAESLLTSDAVYLNSGQVRNLYADDGLAEADISDKPEPTAEKMADALPANTKYFAAQQNN